MVGDRTLELQSNDLSLPPGPLLQKFSLQRHCALKRPGTPTLWNSNLASPDSFRQQSAIGCTSPEETGILVENKASHRNILCARYL